jgi:mannose-6-phosphate isomerase-like protein (cupin superfamily)
MAATWTPATEERDMDSAFFDIKELSAKLAESGQTYDEFLRVDSLNVGIYNLAKYTTDRQSPHLDDEVYYVLEGKSKFVAGEEEREVGAGSVIYVRAGAPHKFFDIEEDLNILVFFSTKRPE